MKAIQILRFFVSIIVAAALMGMPGSALSQVALRHTVTAAASSSIIDHSVTNGLPAQIILLAHDFGTLGPYVSKAVAASYSGSRWRVDTVDGSNLPANAKFNVLSVNPGDNAFVHTAAAANISSNFTIIDHSSLNDHPDARVFVTARKPGTNNPHPVGVFYTSNRWSIFNEDLTAMPAGASFFVYIDERGFVAEATAVTGNNYAASHVSTDGKAAALVFATQYWTGVYNPHPVGVWYNADKWKLFNEDLQPMPANAKCNVLALEVGDNTIYPPVTPRSSVYNGVSTGVEYPYEARLNPQTAITLEAGVYLDGRSTCGTIISNSFAGPTGSYWQGLRI